jgi:hypothetical protein
MLSPEQVMRDLEALRASDPHFQRFGSRAHHYRLNPPLADAELIAIEERHRIALPADFRLFLGRIGNGGAGPGLSKWGEYDEGHNPRPWSSDRDLSKPFPHRKAWSGSGYLDEPLRAEYDDEASHARDHARWSNRETRMNDYWEAAAVNLGTVPLCHYGCGQWAFLVVNGPSAGQVWHDLSCDGLGLEPFEHAGRRLSFGDWYVDWLQRAEAP